MKDLEKRTKDSGDKSKKRYSGPVLTKQGGLKELTKFGGSKGDYDWGGDHKYRKHIYS